jgi:ribonuclease J
LTNPDVHTSGHATRSEQARMIDLLRPRCCLPVHGTFHHLVRHAELARQCGVREVNVVENGTAVLFNGTSLAIEGFVPAGRISVGFGGVDLDSGILRARSELARSGIVTVAFAVDGKGILMGRPSVRTHGVAGVDDAVLRTVSLEVARAAEAARKRRSSAEQRENDVIRVVRRRLVEIAGVKPLVEVHVLEPDD